MYQKGVKHTTRVEVVTIPQRLGSVGMVSIDVRKFSTGIAPGPVLNVRPRNQRGVKGFIRKVKRS